MIEISQSVKTDAGEQHKIRKKKSQKKILGEVDIEKLQTMMKSQQNNHKQNPEKLIFLDKIMDHLNYQPFKRSGNGNQINQNINTDSSINNVTQNKNKQKYSKKLMKVKSTPIISSKTFFSSLSILEPQCQSKAFFKKLQKHYQTFGVQSNEMNRVLLTIKKKEKNIQNAQRQIEGKREFEIIEEKEKINEKIKVNEKVKVNLNIKENINKKKANFTKNIDGENKIQKQRIRQYSELTNYYQYKQHRKVKLMNTQKNQNYHQNKNDHQDKDNDDSYQNDKNELENNNEIIQITQQDLHQQIRQQKRIFKVIQKQKQHDIQKQKQHDIQKQKQKDIQKQDITKRQRGIQKLRDIQKICDKSHQNKNNDIAQLSQVFHLHHEVSQQQNQDLKGLLDCMNYSHFEKKKKIQSRKTSKRQFMNHDSLNLRKKYIPAIKNTQKNKLMINSKLISHSAYLLPASNYIQSQKKITNDDRQRQRQIQRQRLMQDSKKRSQKFKQRFGKLNRSKKEKNKQILQD